MMTTISNINFLAHGLMNCAIAAPNIKPDHNTDEDVFEESHLHTERKVVEPLEHIEATFV